MDFSMSWLYGSIWIEENEHGGHCLFIFLCMCSNFVFCLLRLGMVWSSGLFGRNGVVTMHSLSHYGWFAGSVRMIRGYVFGFLIYGSATSTQDYFGLETVLGKHSR